MSNYIYKEIWEDALNSIKNDYKKQGKEDIFFLWYNLKYIEDTIDTITVGVKTDFMWHRAVEKKIPEQICNKIKKLTGIPTLKLVPKITNEFISDEDNSEIPQSLIKKDIEIQNSITKQEEIYRTENKQTNSFNQETRKNSSLKSEYTFENFITNEGSSNHFAYSIAKTVAEKPGIKNPILFYGGVGLGKTHLMQAIGNKILETSDQTKKICYIQAESFTNEFTNSIVNKKQEAFKNKYRKVDVLLLDDIQFLQNKPGIQEELFYTFEALFANKKQMVFTCDRPLKEIENMTERLVSRLGSGMCLNLNMPNYETRKAILYKKLDKLQISLDDEIIDFIAKIVETNIRDLEGALSNVTGYQEYLGKTSITLEKTQELLKDFYKTPEVGNISVENIKKVVANNFNINVKDLTGSKRTSQIAVARHIAFYLTRNMTELSLSDVGNEFGGRDHSSVLNGVNRIEEKLITDPSLNQQIQHLMKEIKEYKE